MPCNPNQVIVILDTVPGIRNSLGMFTKKGPTVPAVSCFPEAPTHTFDKSPGGRPDWLYAVEPALGHELVVSGTVPAGDGVWVTIPAVESLDVLVSRLPKGTVTAEPQILRAIDSWALALLRRVRGEELAVQAAVIFAGSTEDVATVLAWASEPVRR